MGGIGSGNYGGRGTVEGALSLDVYDLIRKRFLVVGGTNAGSISWSRGGGPEVASMRYAAILHDDCGLLNLLYATTDNSTGEQRKHDCRIHLETTAQPLGGRRWWFVCPETGKRVSKLHMPAGRLTFASREAYRIAYASQRQSPRDRATSRAHKLRRRFGQEGGVGDVVQRPKWMRHATFERQAERIWAADEICDGYLLYTLGRLMKTPKALR